jgi:hypothetical protein
VWHEAPQKRDHGQGIREAGKIFGEDAMKVALHTLFPTRWRQAGLKLILFRKVKTIRADGALSDMGEMIGRKRYKIKVRANRVPLVKLRHERSKLTERAVQPNRLLSWINQTLNVPQTAFNLTESQFQRY